MWKTRGEAMKLPKPKYTIERDEKHYYQVLERPGLWLPGVTGILGVIGGDKTGALMGWATKTALGQVENVLTKHLNGSGAADIHMTSEWIAELMKEARKRPKQVKEAAGDLGTRAHAVIDAIIRGEAVPPVTEDIKSVVDGFLSWWKGSGFTFVAGDTRVASIEYQYGGSLDALATDRSGRLILLDWKTSNSIREDYCFQIGAYSQAFIETYGLKPEAGVCVRFGKEKPEFEPRTVASLDEAFDGFRAARELYDSLRRPLWVEQETVKA